MTCANVSVAIALAGGFAMLLAASGTGLDLHGQIEIIRMQLLGSAKGRSIAKAAALTPATTFQSNAIISPPPADVVSLAWSNGAPMQH